MSRPADHAVSSAVDGSRKGRLSPESARLLIETIEEVEREEAEEQECRNRHQSARRCEASTDSRPIEELPETD